MDEHHVSCDCDDWKEDISGIIDACASYYYWFGVGYEGKTFIYCPWCGCKLKEVRDD